MIDQQIAVEERMSFSRMEAFEKSPRHYLWERANPKTQTPAMLFGKAFHNWVLQPETYHTNFLIDYGNWPKKPTKAQINAKNPTQETKDMIALWDEFSASYNNRELIVLDNQIKIERMHEAIMENKRAAELIMQLTSTEKKLEWADPETGVLCKGFLDGTEDNYTVELKTTECAQPDAFARTAWNYKMHKQGAFYLDGRVHSGKFKNKGELYFIAVEKEEPHGVTVLKASQEFINLGRQEYQLTLENFNLWQLNNRPDIGYEWHTPFGEFSLKPPRWAQ